MTCKCLEYGKSYLNSSDSYYLGMGTLTYREEGMRLRECTYFTQNPYYCAFCTKCKIHNKFLDAHK